MAPNPRNLLSRFSRFAPAKLSVLRALERAGTAESGLLEMREVALVPSSSVPEVCPAEHALTTGGEHEKNNCHAWLCADCTSRIRAAEFDG